MKTFSWALMVFSPSKEGFLLDRGCLCPQIFSSQSASSKFRAQEE